MKINAHQLIAFETRIKELWETGQLPFLVHLCGGNEQQLIDHFKCLSIQEGDWVLSSHRSHYHYLLHGGDPDRLEREIRNGNSMFIFDKEINFMSSAILGGMCGIAAGLALGMRMKGSPRSVFCFLGDGASDNGHLYEALQYVASLELKCVFIVEDNNRSCGVSRTQRGAGTSLLLSLVGEPMWGGYDHLVRYHYTPTYPHAGSGCTHKIQFDPQVVRRFSK